MATLVPLYAEDRFRLPALGAGSLLSARALTMFVVGFFAAMSLRRSGYRLPMYIGYAATAGGMVMMSFGPRGIGTLVLGVLVVERGHIVQESLITQVVVVTVTLSLVVHSLTAWPGIRWLVEPREPVETPVQTPP